MLEIFTPRAKKVLDLAKSTAQVASDDFIGTQHILAGLFEESAGVAHHILESKGVTAQRIMAESARITQPGDGLPKELVLNTRAKNALEYALEEAKSLSHRYIGTEHLLLGLLREKESIACQILKNLGVDIEVMRTEVLEILGFYEKNFFLRDGLIIAKDSVGEQVIGKYNEVTDKVHFDFAVPVVDIKRIIEAIRNDKKSV